MARVEGRDVTDIEPPDEALVEEVHDVERAVIATLTGSVQMSVSPDERNADEVIDSRSDDEVIDSRSDDEVIDSRSDGLPPVACDDSGDVGAAARDLPTRTLRLTVSEETARFWRSLERVHAGIWTGRSFVAFLAGGHECGASARGHDVDRAWRSWPGHEGRQESGA